MKAAEGLLHPNIGSGTKRGIEAMRTAYQAEIAALKTVAAKATELEAKTKELEAKLAAGPSKLPEAVEKELTDLRQFRREADVTKDPEFVAKYDGKINTNTAKVEAMLTAIGKANGADDAAISKVLASYKSKGYTLDNLAGEIQGLQKANQFGQAQRLTALLMQNEELTEGKSAEIAAWQTDAAGRSAAQQAKVEALNARVGDLTRTTYAQTMAAETEAYAKDFPFIKAPPAPAETDAPAVKQAKTEAQSFYNEAMGKAKTELEALSASITDPEKAAVRNGRLYAMAAAGLTFKNLIAPKMAQEMAAMRAELETLRAKVTSSKKAGDLSARHAVEAAGGSKVPTGKGLSMAEAFAAQLEATANQ